MSTNERGECRQRRLMQMKKMCVSERDENKYKRKVREENCE